MSGSCTVCWCRGGQFRQGSKQHLSALFWALQLPSHMQVVHFRASLEAVNSVQFIAGRELLLAASKDCKVHLYTSAGSLVGMFGEHEWNIDDPSTFQAAKGWQSLPLLDVVDTLFNAAQAFEPGPGAPILPTAPAPSPRNACLQASAIACMQPRWAAIQLEPDHQCAMLAQDAQHPCMFILPHVTRPSERAEAKAKAQSEQGMVSNHFKDVLQVYAIACAEEATAAKKQEPPPWEGTKPAQYYLQARRERQQASAAHPARDAVHAQLRVQPAVELPRTIGEVMQRTPRQKRAGKLGSKAPPESAGDAASKGGSM